MVWKLLKSLFSTSFHKEDVPDVHADTQVQNNKINSKSLRPSVEYLLTKDLGHLCELLEIDNKTQLAPILLHPEEYYRTFRIPKRNGKSRLISAPFTPLYRIQKKIYEKILIHARVHSAAKGFCISTSIVHNAREHLHAKDLLKVDIRNFFPSIHQSRVVAIFRNLGYEYTLAYQLAYLCCLNGKLPQGSPASPALSNLALLRLDSKLSEIAGNRQFIYTRYADDLSFSGNILSKNELLAEISKTVQEEKLILNKKKTRFITGAKRKIITGISISSGKLTIPKSKKREIRKVIYYIKTRGISKHLLHINSKDAEDWYLEKILGYLSFWRAVEPENAYVLQSVKYIQSLRKQLLYKK
ncbi:reverse transcriptase domain-containing protein [Apibacter sp. HY039]|uniref:reverse transcriptase domain-containing protein n=1 Tax=Apibacter sp. HY039 TaxID=2501476 RepID=UPI000FEBF129|nr:reverse transcriptase domain-containing protein [Apibacter sp. HY039]